MGADYPYINASIMTINVAVWSLIVLFRIVLPLFAESVSLPWQPGRTLLDMIMHRGKINWIVAHILGYESFEKEMGYSEDEAEWCRKNKTSLWKTMVENGHLYATDPLVVRTYIRKDPFISIMGEKTPASIGVWMGILLIDEYMKKHPDMTIKDLLAKTDYHQMLAETDFKP